MKSDVKNGYFGNQNAKKDKEKQDVYVQMRVKKSDKQRWQEKASKSKLKNLTKWIIDKIEREE